MSFERVAILGCGLIGGSFALGLKANGYSGEIIGWGRAETLEKAEQRGAIDRGTTELSEAVAEADLVYLATPVALIMELLPPVARSVKAGALITDAGSTKARICRLAREAVPQGVLFLGGHPMAGKETRGIENADAALLAGSKYVVTPERAELMDAAPVKEFFAWVRRLGAEPMEMDAETHDWVAAMISHLPQLLSTALASAVWDETDDDGLPVSLAGIGFRDMTRLAASPYEMWRDICLTNSDNIGRALERLEQKLERLRMHLRSKELAEEFAKAQRTWGKVRETGGRRSDE
jgi:prephenate dehydrogenase